MEDGVRMVVRTTFRLLLTWLTGIGLTAGLGCSSKLQQRCEAVAAAAPDSPAGEQACELAEVYSAEFGESSADAERRERLQLQQRLAGIESVSVEQFQAGWQIDVDVDGQPAREVLTRLLADLGLRLPEDAEFAKALDQPVRLQRRTSSRLEAIEAICSQIGVHADYEAVRRVLEEPPPAVCALPVLVLLPGKRPFPLTFAGPYAIGISRLDEFPPHASGYLCLSVVAAVPASVQGFWSQESWSGLLDFHARDARGVDLVVRDTNLCAWGWNTLGPIALRRGMANYILMRLLRSVGTIHLDGRISATIPVGVETIRLDGLQTGLVAEGKKARVRVDRFQAFAETAEANPRLASERKYWLSLTVQGDKYIPIAVVALNKAGEAVKISKYPIDTSYYRSRIEPGPGTSSPVDHSWHYDLDDEPESLIVKAFVELAFVEFPVQLEADLRRSEEQPVEPIPLQFSGSAPLQIEVLALSEDSPFRKAALRLTNTSNKDICSINCDLIYVNPAGQTAPSSQPPISPPPTLETAVLPLLVPKASTVEIKATAFSSPKNATSATAILKAVFFADGTTWRPIAADHKNARRP